MTIENLTLDGNNKEFSSSSLLVQGDLTLENGATVQDFYSVGAYSSDGPLLASKKSSKNNLVKPACKTVVLRWLYRPALPS